MKVSWKLRATRFKGITAQNADFLIYDGQCVRLRASLALQSYFGDLLSWKEIAVKYKMGHKLVLSTAKKLREWFPEESRAIYRARLSSGKRGNQNGYSGPPRPLLDKEVLTQDLRNGYGLLELQQRYGISEFLLHRNIQWHGLTDLLSETGRLYGVRLLNRDPAFRETLDRLCPGLLDVLLREQHSDSVDRKLLRCFVDAYFTVRKLQLMGTLIHRRAAKRKYSFNFNRGELLIVRELLSIGVDFEQQVKFGDYVYDFYIPSLRLVLEVDGTAHKLSHMVKTDLEKTAVIKRKGLRLERIAISDKGFFDCDKLHKLCASTKQP